MKDEKYFVYAGIPNENIDWILIPDTQADREEAIKKGYTAFSTMSFSHGYEKGQKEPNRKGDLWLDFDSKVDEGLAIAAARNAKNNLFAIRKLYWYSAELGNYSE